MSGPRLAIVGATGAVGSVVRQLVTERPAVWGQIDLIASARSAGKQLPVRGELVTVSALAPGVFDGVDIAVFDVPDEVSAQWVPIAARRGAVCVDNSAAFRLDPKVPLIVPEINAQAATDRPKNIIANPNCTTMSMIVAMGALHRQFTLTGLVVASYQAASGGGQAGIDRLVAELEVVAGKGLGSVPGDVRKAIDAALGSDSPFPAPLAMNVIPWAGSAKDDGWNSEELKVRAESRKILGLPRLPVSVTCVRVPVLTTHSLAVHATFEDPVSAGAAIEVLGRAPGVELLSLPTPADVVGTDATFVGRVRSSLDNPRALELFVCGDNLRKGAALNTLQIAELVADELGGR